MDRGAWWATVHGVAKSWTQLSNQNFFSVRARYVAMEAEVGMMQGWVKEYTWPLEKEKKQILF